MNKEKFKAAKTRSNRPGWSVTFKHPLSSRPGKRSPKMRRGLGTTDDAEADRLISQLNELLSDEKWWSTSKRTEAEAEDRFDPVVISIFFDEIDVGKHNPLELRELSACLCQAKMRATQKLCSSEQQGLAKRLC